MSRRRQPEKEAAEVARLLAPLAGATARVPSSETVYWRAQARSAIEEASRRRRRTLLPLRLFHLALGAGAIAVAALASVSPLVMRVPPGAELFTAPLLIAMVAAGGYWLAEAGPAP